MTTNELKEKLLGNKTSVAITMNHPYTRDMPFYGPNKNAIWVSNEVAAWADLSRVSAIFEPHNRMMFSQRKSWLSHHDGDWLAFMKEIKVPIVMQGVELDIPSSVAYPLEIIADTTHETPIHGSLDWMLALAIHLEVKHIVLYGASYDTPHERYYQSVGAAYWIGVARGKGISVVTPRGCKLLSPIVPGHYGVEYPPWDTVNHPRTFAFQYDLPSPEKGFKE